MGNSTIGRILFTGLLAGTLHLTSSCESCSRDRNNSNINNAEEINGEIYGKGTDADMERSGNMSGTPMDTVSGAAQQGRTSGRPAASPDNGVENSNSNAYDRSGEPRDSGGTSGAGMGTGTGSTGNNSKVTNPKDQNN